ncbi:MAG TPA: HDOD domain-containing protein [Opitutus sp.]|nr:HDOD domain-containing protein [Opitutus sp.]
MPSVQLPDFASSRVYSDEIVRRRVDACPKLASLESINRALLELLASDRSMASQIASIIRRDPSLSARLLRMVNSVYFGLAGPVHNLEEAVIVLGLRQIRELATTTPVLEELERINHAGPKGLPWRELWRHSIGTAILTREILSSAHGQSDNDTHYLVGLLHNIGKVVMASSFPEELTWLMSQSADDTATFAAEERRLIGWDHARIGAHYLRRHNLPEEIAEAVEYHNAPGRAPEHQVLAAAAQVADCLARYCGISSGFETVPPVAKDGWQELEGWRILYGTDSADFDDAHAALAHAVRDLPDLLATLL